VTNFLHSHDAYTNTMVRKILRERLDLPRLMATSWSQMSLIVWDEQYTESEAMSATTGTD